MKKPKNTTESTYNNPVDFLIESQVVGASGAIEHQKARGQDELVNSDVLPVRCFDEDWQKKLERYGVQFLEVIEDDPIFQEVILPQGWKKVPTDHSMWSDLIDDKGRKRASIFYKAAFYDRSAHISLSRRYNIDYDYELSEKGKLVYYATDGDKVIYRTPEVAFTKKHTPEHWQLQDKLRDEVTTWLDDNYPEWENEGAYW